MCTFMFSCIMLTHPYMYICVHTYMHPCRCQIVYIVLNEYKLLPKTVLYWGFISKKALNVCCIVFYSIGIQTRRVQLHVNVECNRCEWYELPQCVYALPIVHPLGNHQPTHPPTQPIRVCSMLQYGNDA